MSVQLSELSNEHLLYLKQKWSAEIQEIELNQARAEERLALRLERRDTRAEELAAMQSNLSTAQTLLQHLQDTNAPNELVTAQESVVADLQARYDAQTLGSGSLTDAEAVLQQADIDALAWSKTYRAGKITEIDILLAS